MLRISSFYYITSHKFGILCHGVWLLNSEDNSSHEATSVDKIYSILCLRKAH